METNLTGEARPEVDREEYARYEAYLEQRYRDSPYTAMYRATFQARKDAKVAREEAAKAEASNKNQPLPAASQENALSDGEDPLQAWKPRKHRQNKEPLNEASSSSALPRGLKDVGDVRHRVNKLSSTTRSPSKIVSVSSKPTSNEVTTTAISGRAAPFEAEPYSRRSSSASETLPSRPKRSAASSFNDDDRPSVSKQRRRSSTLSNAEVIEQPLARRTGFNRQPPKWYKELPKPNNTRDASKSAEETMLFRIKEAMRTAKASNAQNRAVVLPSKFGELINMLHKIVFLPVSDKLLRKTRMLDNADGLPQLFDSEFAGGIAWPWYLRADAEELYNKWCGQVFETDLYRGLNRAMGGKGKGNSSTSDTLDDTYRHYRLVNPKEHGNGLLINGTWWPTQLAVLRDGGHGSSQGGITSHPKEGAFSVIMAGGLDPKNKPYPNIDRGDEVLYCGTDNPSTDLNEPSRDTKAMILNNENGRPVRLFRSSNLDSKYAPELGFRYDGLYSVVDFEILDPPEEKRKRHRFKLVRCEGQDPIRSDGPEKRPTKEEIQEYEKDKKSRGR